MDLNGLHTQSIISSHEIRSPLAATRANSSASAASPTGSACAAPSSSNWTTNGFFFLSQEKKLTKFIKNKKWIKKNPF